MPHFNEHALEMAIMELFQQEGYIYTHGEEIHKEVSDVLLRDDLRMYLRSRYEDITALEVESVIARLTAHVGFSDYENNVATYGLITEGFSLKREDASQPDLFVEPIDFTTESNNIFRIVNQLEIQGREKRIPDGIVYINEEECIGCGLCAKNCKFTPSRITMDKKNRKAHKCDLCRTREGGPQCIKECPVVCLGLASDPLPYDPETLGGNK